MSCFWGSFEDAGPGLQFKLLSLSIVFSGISVVNLFALYSYSGRPVSHCVPL